MAKTFSIIVVIAALLMGLLGTTGCIRSTPGPTYSYPSGGMGPGSMMGPGGMMGSGGRPGGMMGPGGPYRSGGTRINMDKATELVQNYLSTRNDPDLKASEIMEFSYNFYVMFLEKSTGIGAFEALIDPFTGDMYPETGPNMMWNTKYGMMSGMMWGYNNPSTPMTITEEQAKKSTQEFLNGYLSGAKPGDADKFYGYYTVEIMKDNAIYGMLSVNGYTGQVWFHTWHGQFLASKEL